MVRFRVEVSVRGGECRDIRGLSCVFLCRCGLVYYHDDDDDGCRWGDVEVHGRDIEDESV